ncbi:MAG: PHP domain-containing protein [Clostridiales bacterium]|nr:PHP domain-containing protein [Clostridiales bacterium]
MGKYAELTKKYRMIYDIHTHTIFSHGKGTIEDNVKAAISKGLSSIGIAEHGPGHVLYGVKRKQLPVMKKEIERLKSEYKDIEILLGVEANIINPSGRLDVTSDDIKKLDYVLAGYHYATFGEKPLKALKTHIVNFRVFNRKTKDTKQKIYNTALVIKALYENDIKVLTHPGDKGDFDLMAIAKACEETNTLMEINTWHNAPLISQLKELIKTQVLFVISSDAHSPDRVGFFEPGLKRALEAGLDPARIVNLEEI